MNQLIGQKKINKKTYFRLRWFDLVCCGKIVVNERAERENKFGSFCIYLGRDRNDQFQQFHLCFYIVTRYYQINLNYMYIHICQVGDHSRDKEASDWSEIPRAQPPSQKIFLKRIIFRPGHCLHNNIPAGLYTKYFISTRCFVPIWTQHSSLGSPLTQFTQLQ